jgi:hypothetical protein
MDLVGTAARGRQTGPTTHSNGSALRPPGARTLAAATAAQRHRRALVAATLSNVWPQLSLGAVDSARWLSMTGRRAMTRYKLITWVRTGWALTYGCRRLPRARDCDCVHASLWFKFVINEGLRLRADPAVEPWCVGRIGA